VAAQIAVLLALTAQLFDALPLERMTVAEQAVRDAVARLPVPICTRLESADALSAADRVAIIELARKALARFLERPPVADGSTGMGDE
jgi:F-type H+-transporting ATPase subunit alpha